MPIPPDLQIFFPNGGTQASQMYIWDGSKPVVWTGGVTVGAVTSSGQIADGVDPSIIASVLDFLSGDTTSSNPLTVAIVDTTGHQIASFGGGTQYVVGDTTASPTGNVILWQDTGPALRAVTAAKPLPVDVKTTTGINVVVANTTAITVGGSVLVTNTTGTAVPVTVQNTVNSLITNTTGASVPTSVQNTVSALVTNTTGTAVPVSVQNTVTSLISNTTGTAVPVTVQNAVAVTSTLFATAANQVSGGQLVQVVNTTGATQAFGAGTTGATTIRAVLPTDQTAIPVTIAHGKTIKFVSGSTTADTDVIAAVSSKRLKVFALKALTFGTTATTVLWKSNGTTGTEVWRTILQAATGTKDGETQAVSVPSFMFATVAGEKLTLDTNTSDSVHYAISYWDDDAT